MNASVCHVFVDLYPSLIVLCGVECSLKEPVFLQMPLPARCVDTVAAIGIIMACTVVC